MSAPTRRAGIQSQSRDNGVGRDDGVICNLCAILDDGEFSLRMLAHGVRSKDKRVESTHYHAILPNLHMIADGRRFYDGIGTNVDEVTDLHRVIVECTAIRFVRWPERVTTRRTDVNRIEAPRGSWTETHLMTHPSPTRQ